MHRGRLFRPTVFIIISCILFLQGLSAAPPLQTGSFIRDAEIEATLHEYITPLFRVAKLDPKSLNLYVIVNPEINASASIRYSIFINTGLLLESKTPEQVIGVLAHETGHIAGGHISRTEGAMGKATLAAMAAMALGTAAAIASNSSDAAMASILGGMSMAQGIVFHYSRGQEGTADSSGVHYLDDLKWSSRGLLEFMQMLEKQEYLSPDQQDVYMRTHPFSRDRVDFLKQHLKNSPYANNRLPQDFYEKYDRMIAKLSAYLEPPGKTLLTYRATDQSVKARYARAIAFYRENNFPEASKQLDGLIHEFPRDPYFHEIKGQFMFEQGRLDDALTSYKQAIEIKPDAPLIHLAYAQTLIEKNQPKMDKEAIHELRNVLKDEEENSFAWRLLAIAYGRGGNLGMSSLALAEEALANDKPKIALTQSKRAQYHLKGGPDTLRAADIQSLAERLVKEKE
jgi:predicted Zn-dependent protease